MDGYQLFTYLCMLVVLPLFVVVFMTALIVLAPILVPMWAWGRWHS